MSARRLIESERFPIEFVSKLAERESWRKEVHRPIYHVHKWWAKRLGSVFRSALLGCLLPDDRSLEEAFYARHDFAPVTVFEPFMGSGTTVGEAHKLGCTVVGRDINPVACEAVRVAFGPLDRARLVRAFEHLSATVGERIRALYRTTDRRGNPAETLYYFWVHVLACPACGAEVDLFSSRVFARNAYPGRKPEVQVCCPACGEVQGAPNDTAPVKCRRCASAYAPGAGVVQGAKATCPRCHKGFAVAATVRATSVPPTHRLYARPEGWSSLAAAIFGAGFSVVEAHPVRAEMSVATPKSQASEPIQIDVLLVCRTRAHDRRTAVAPELAWTRAEEVATARCERLEAVGFTLSRHDRVVARCAQFLVALGPVPEVPESAWQAVAHVAATRTPPQEHGVVTTSGRPVQGVLPLG